MPLWSPPTARRLDTCSRWPRSQRRTSSTGSCSSTGGWATRSSRPRRTSRESPNPRVPSRSTPVRLMRTRNSTNCTSRGSDCAASSAGDIWAGPTLLSRPARVQRLASGYHGPQLVKLLEHPLHLLRRYWAEAFAAASLVALVVGVNPLQLGHIFGHIQWHIAALLVPVVLVLYVCRGTAWWIALRGIGEHIPYLMRFDAQLHEIRPAFVRLCHWRTLLPIIGLQAIAAAFSFLLFYLALLAVGLSSVSYITAVFALGVAYTFGAVSFLP